MFWAILEGAWTANEGTSVSHSGMQVSCQLECCVHLWPPLLLGSYREIWECLSKAVRDLEHTCCGKGWGIWAYLVPWRELSNSCLQQFEDSYNGDGIRLLHSFRWINQRAMVPDCGFNGSGWHYGGSGRGRIKKSLPEWLWNLSIFFKTWLDKVRAELIRLWWQSCFKQGSWTREPAEFHPSSISVILIRDQILVFQSNSASLLTVIQ